MRVPRRALRTTIGHAGPVGDVRDLSSAPSARRSGWRPVDDELTLRAERHAPRLARHWVMRAIAAEGVVGSHNQVIELLTGELVSNAVVHGPADAQVLVGLRIDRRTVRVSVRDTGQSRPRVRHPEPTAPSGRGLALVEALSSAWGTATHPDGGKTVWFDVELDD